MNTNFSILNSYSQYGEDIVAYHIFEPLEIFGGGCYVDIGCGHPIEYNNTYLFYLMGWSGLQIDPCNSLQSIYKELRPKDTFMNMAVSSEEQAISYYEFSPYFYSTCEQTRANILQDDPAVEFLGVRDVPCRRLSEILYEYETRLQNQLAVDLMSIDVEGLELEVLKSHDWTSFRPKVLMIEVLGLQKAKGLLLPKCTNCYAIKDTHSRLLPNLHFSLQILPMSTSAGIRNYR
jgi:FkbM family methyltransferase